MEDVRSHDLRNPPSNPQSAIRNPQSAIRNPQSEILSRIWRNLAPV
jgi:hypothetical protein